MTRRIDLNSDMGESYGNFRVGNDEEIMPLITSASAACGFHGGDPVTMGRIADLSKRHRVGVGAHPGLPDLMGFGRREMKITPEEARAYVLYQAGALRAFLESRGMRMQHVKPHGAFYSILMKNEDLSRAVAEAILDLDRSLFWYMPVPNKSAEWARSMGVRVVGELYVDMDYAPDGSLVVRRQQYDHEASPKETAEKIIRFLDEGKVKTLAGTDLEIEATSVCVHGDTKNAAVSLRAIREELDKNGVEITSIKNILAPTIVA
ncbi:LamB/YcsF family protein [Candidatus Bathyarchaeota archaeon]|nr:LamB/YcsF family protein [Candidatus Bathyarchaeota archaeon]